MKNKYPRISVIVICYNQEDVIERALNSILCQRDYLFELVVSDDCSTDSTWKIIKEYQKKHHRIIKAYRNEKNLGVYENYQSTYDKVNGDIVFLLSGDDEFGRELFKLTCETISKADLNYRKDKFCVITDYKRVTPEGNGTIVKKNSLVKKHDPFSLKFRGIIVNRALGESISTFNTRKAAYIERRKNFKIPSSLQEGFLSIVPFVHAKKILYIPYIGNIYYSNIGVSSQFKKYKSQHLEGLIEYCNEISNYFKNLNKYDRNWLAFHKIKSEFLLNPSLNKLIGYFYNFLILSMDPLRKYFIFGETKVFLRSILLFFK